jgi:hypothetical protein
LIFIRFAGLPAYHQFGVTWPLWHDTFEHDTSEPEVFTVTVKSPTPQKLLPLPVTSNNHVIPCTCRKHYGRIVVYGGQGRYVAGVPYGGNAVTC